MVFYICQTLSERYLRKNATISKWVAIGKDDLLAEIEETYTSEGRKICIHGKGYEDLMVFDNQRNSFANRLQNNELVTWDVFTEGIKTGATLTKGVKVKGFLQSYIYDVFQYKGNIYSCYEVGFGNKGIYICFYKNDELVAVVDKQLRVVNFQDKYTCYLLNEEDYPAVMAYTVQYDSNKFFADTEDNHYYTVQNHRLDTIQKEVLAKYDATFIDKVKSMEPDERKAENA